MRCGASMAANTGSGYAGAGALSHPRVNVCGCVCPCRSWGRPLEPSWCLPELEAAAGGPRTPRTKGSLCHCWRSEGADRRPLAPDWRRADADRQEERRRTERKRSKSALSGRTRGRRFLR